MNARLRKTLWLLCLLLAACGKVRERHTETLAASSHAVVLEQRPGATPFIAWVTLSLDHFADLQSASFTIAPRPGSLSRPVSATFERSWLAREGDYNNYYRRLTLPVFGLYAGYPNQVSLTLTFRDGSSQVQPVAVATAPYAEAAAIYRNPAILTPRSAGAAPGVDFIAIHNGITTPAIIDTDGNLRWVGRGVASSVSALFDGTSFYVGNLAAPELSRVDLQGTWISMPLAGTRYTNFHHDLSRGKTGMLAEFDATTSNGVQEVESVLAEIDTDGRVLKEWDMGAIFRKYMLAHGDDPATFVRDGVDWFHMNSAIYSPADDALIVSRRENFVVKLDYQTGEPKWLLGDTTKYWYANFPSLRALALRLTAGKAPIGQHSLSLTSNGELLLFNNGFGSVAGPPGAPPGETRSYSTPSRYAIDEKARTAAEVWTWQHAPALYSDICSSAYETTPGNYLLAYSVADQRTRARVIGVDSTGKVNFDFEYPTNLCATVFVAVPIDFGALSLK